MFITKPHKYQVNVLWIYLAEDCNHKFSLNIWTSDSVFSHSCQKCNLKAAFTASQHKDILIRIQMVLSSSHRDMNIYLSFNVKNKLWNEGEKSYERHSLSKTTQDQSVCIPAIYSIKRAHVSIRKTHSSRESTSESFLNIFI